ncbi:hypothetical protein LJR042_003529 [Microbacterium maritypicum]|uniref:hypothetical protein n=1 Tax=Microbacterium maritypicum TaxID=33918 RepID=UPI0010A12DB2
MTILCATTANLPGIRPCTELGAHRVTCPDHPGFRDNPGTCWGCLPRAADRGFLCSHCYERTVNAVAGWRDFCAALGAADGRLVSPEIGGSSTPAGFSNLTLTFLTVDECERHLASRGDRTVDLWVHDEQGAADAIRFAVAAEQAYRSLEIETHEKPVIRERCEKCDSLTIANTHTERGATVVTCAFCGHERARIRPDTVRWIGSATCEHQLHADCDGTSCPCDCHLLGVQSRPSGVQALWDADQHTVAPNYRASWIIQDALTIGPSPERTAA